MLMWPLMGVELATKNGQCGSSIDWIGASFRRGPQQVEVSITTARVAELRDLNFGRACETLRAKSSAMQSEYRDMQNTQRNAHTRADAVSVSANPQGPFVTIATNVRMPGAGRIGDFDVFVDPSDGSTFHVAGANCYYLVYSSGADEGSYEHAWVEEVLETSQQLNLNVLRVWTFQDQWWEKERALQTSPGEYNERFLVALDTLLVRASARGIRLLLCLSNYWEDYGARETFFFSDGDGDGAAVAASRTHGAPRTSSKPTP